MGKFQKAQSIRLPTSAELEKAKKELTKAHVAFFSLKAARDHKTVAINKVTTELQRRAMEVRSKVMFERIGKVKYKVNKRVPLHKVGVAGLPVRPPLNEPK